MPNSMSEAEQELLSLYTQKAYEAYQSGNMKQTEHYAAKIAKLQPGNGHSVFLRGAVTGRAARPGKEMQNIKAAIQIWMPLLESLEGETLELMKAAVDEAFSVITFIPVELSARKWDAYLNMQTAEELAEVLNFLMKQGKESVYCSIRDIAYVESLNKKTIIHRKEEEPIYCSEPLYVLEERLAAEPFFRCHNAFLINLDYIQSFGADSITVQGDKIPVSKYRKKDFMNALANYRGRML